nr:MAG TPA: hypothetical protein [Caudoviricetes sp.]
MLYGPKRTTFSASIKNPQSLVCLSTSCKKVRKVRFSLLRVISP